MKIMLAQAGKLRMAGLLLQVRRSLDFLADLPHLRILMMGKGTAYLPVSVHFLSELMRKLTRKHPTRDVLRISYPGNAEWEANLAHWDWVLTWRHAGGS
jgi:hypothetical protein